VTAPLVPDDPTLKAILGDARTIAVVGLSSKPWRDSFRIARYLQDHGYRIVPVNPKETEVLGEQAFPSLLDIPFPIDAVDVFRRSEHTPEVARQAVAVGAKVLWLQLDIVSDEARTIAEEAGMDVVMGVCIMVEHHRLEVS